MFKLNTMHAISVLVLFFCIAHFEGVTCDLVSKKLGVSRIKRSTGVQGRTFCDGVPNDEMDKTRVDTTQRVENLLQEMQKENLDAYIVPSSDEHLSEYVSDYDKRKGYISGFKGSAGTAVVLASGARAMWTDGRYFLQADQELDCNWNLMKSGMPGVPKIVEWLKASLSPGSRVGADPKLISAKTWMENAKELNESSIFMTSIERNLIDSIWPSDERPPMSQNPINILDLQYTGKKWEDKIRDLREEMKNTSADMIIITAMDEVAWLFNLRGSDVPFTPVFRSYAIIEMERILLFLDANIRPEIDLYLRVNQCDQLCIEIFSYNSIIPHLRAMSAKEATKQVLVPARGSYSGGASFAIYSAVPEQKVLMQTSPVLVMKAKKNKVESIGMRNAHLRDAVALIDFLAMLDQQIGEGEKWDELSAAKKLEEFRSEQVDFFSPSFGTISAFGSNGAIIHYRPSEDTNKVITRDSLYLLDSGGQYKDGTTDVTRTLHYGTPTDIQVEMYTRVLKGALDLAMVVFPAHTKDTRIDILARKSLYEVGLDYAHGTGHGIGAFLSVHEDPTLMNIGGKVDHDMEEGHFFSDEPGYYLPGEFGIRLETILSVVPIDVKYGEAKMFGFLPVTLVPFESKLIDTALLSRKQCEYLNMYHLQVRKIVGRELNRQDRTRGFDYMMNKTEPLNCSSAGTEDASAILKIFEDNYSAFELTNVPDREIPGQKLPEKQPSISAGLINKVSSGLLFVSFVVLAVDKLLLR